MCRTFQSYWEGIGSDNSQGVLHCLAWKKPNPKTSYVECTGVGVHHDWLAPLHNGHTFHDCPMGLSSFACVVLCLIFTYPAKAMKEVTIWNGLIASIAKNTSCHRKMILLKDTLDIHTHTGWPYLYNPTRYESMNLRPCWHSRTMPHKSAMVKYRHLFHFFAIQWMNVLECKLRPQNGPRHHLDYCYSCIVLGTWSIK